MNSLISDKKVATSSIHGNYVDMVQNIDRVNICGIPVDAITMNQTVEAIDEAILTNTHLQHCALNAAKLVHALKDEPLRKSIIESDIITADGKSIVWASKLLRQPVPERVTGIDLMQNLVELASKRNYKIFLFGAEEYVVKKVLKKYSDLYGPQIIAGYRNGYYTKEEEPGIARSIADSGAHMLFVAITSPKKETFLNSYDDLARIPFTMGVGGSFDVIAGIVKRAPVWMQNMGLEWLFRVIQEPSRMWKRYLTTNTAFVFLILKELVFPGQPKT